MGVIHAGEALLETGWARDVRVVLDGGRITSIEAGATPQSGDYRTGILLPAPANLHSHAFQRAMAGLTERRGADPSDNFWTWRKAMYAFLDALTPDDVEAIAAFVQMEMLEAGYATNVEFHYLHHGPDGAAYDNLGEMSHRIAAAASQTGVGLTLLPVLYQQGGCDGRPLGAGQIRFGNDVSRFERLVDSASDAVKPLPADTRLGISAHSLRAVSREGLAACIALAPGAPLHMHLAEQTGEVEEVLASYGARPTEWLLANADVDARWCLIHCTQMTDEETRALARTGAVAGLCPITEGNLGDGIFNGTTWLEAGGRFGVGSDSNVRISLSEELRQLEYSQRLRDRSRAALATREKSAGRVLLEGVARGGAQAAGREAGVIAAGKLADLVALDTGHITLEGRSGDLTIDSWVFAGDDNMVSDVWAAGRHQVQGGRHIAHDAITGRYRATIRRLGARL
ncbi:formimidoylglutamate deiminase [Glycocaulis abyssi]|uniref:Formimidoylglutamate deiminase n=1 Tax=Glycocaulis abyssi TaxID=1433403 RepID=A0ABV9NCF9_9PROT